MKERKKKDENAPKRGLTAFLHFVADRRESCKKEHPELSHKEVISKLGEIWNGLADKEKEPYQKKAQIDKDKYKKAKDEYNEKLKENTKKPKDEDPVPEKKVKKVRFSGFLKLRDI